MIYLKTITRKIETNKPKQTYPTKPGVFFRFANRVFPRKPWDYAQKKCIELADASLEKKKKVTEYRTGGYGVQFGHSRISAAVFFYRVAIRFGPSPELYVKLADALQNVGGYYSHHFYSKGYYTFTAKCCNEALVNADTGIALIKGKIGWQRENLIQEDRELLVRAYNIKVRVFIDQGKDFHECIEIRDLLKRGYPLPELNPSAWATGLLR